MSSPPVHIFFLLVLPRFLYTFTFDVTAGTPGMLQFLHTQQRLITLYPSSPFSNKYDAALELITAPML
jgi:hypothetical protein